MAMQSRRDLYQAHRLMTQRAALALLRGEPDVPDQPLRRLNMGTIAGVLVAVIVAGIFGIWGLLFHGAPGLPGPGSLVIDKQTGTPYVYCESNKDICPVINYASALVELQSASVKVADVNQSSLTSIPHGPLIGIPGLPPDLPAHDLLIKQPWSVCTQTQFGVAGVTGGTQTSTVIAGGIQPGGQQLGSTLLLVSAQSQNQIQDWVIADGQRMQIKAATREALFSSTQPVNVPLVWLNSITQGPDFAAPSIQGLGSTVTGPTGPTQVGQVYKVVVGGTTKYYVLQQNDFLASITQTQAALLGIETPQLQDLAASQLTGHVAAAPLPDNGLPATETSVAAPQASDPLCTVFAGPGASLAMQVEFGGQMPSNGTPTGAPAGSDRVDQVALPPGKGALVLVAGTSFSYSLVTDGHRYALASTQVASFLGYQLSQAVQLPAGVLDLIPPGPPFDPQLASLPVSGG